jgi:glucose/arabinose dehydrogenase
MRRRRMIIGLAVFATLAASVSLGCFFRGYLAGFLPSSAAESGDITLPSGCRIAVYADSVPNARQMALGPSGVVFVGSRSSGWPGAWSTRTGSPWRSRILG